MEHGRQRRGFSLLELTGVLVLIALAAAHFRFGSPDRTILTLHRFKFLLSDAVFRCRRYSMMTSDPVELSTSGSAFLIKYKKVGERRETSARMDFPDGVSNVKFRWWNSPEQIGRAASNSVATSGSTSSIKFSQKFCWPFFVNFDLPNSSGWTVSVGPYYQTEISPPSRGK